MKLRFALAFLSFSHTICCSRVITIEEEVIEEPLAKESATSTKEEPGASTAKPKKTGLVDESAEDAAADGTNDDDAAPCRALGARESCEQCCQLGAPDPAACITSAACADKPPAGEAGEPPAGEDCRTTGCAEGETCGACWGGYACLPSGWTC